ncbi:MAG TPA: HlyD family efflux transporter periplasmic adaptor subunit [Chloroflexaceae bacterium]|nr:HlyD family efflux transporter periplasmic adaptor subunit [Chloroflexaceae bacterium]
MTTRRNRAALGLALVTSLALAACSAPVEDLAAPTAAPGAATAAAVAPTGPAAPGNLPRIENGRLVVPGRAVPAYSLDLGFERGGPVAEILVDLGEEVGAGEPVARLDTRYLALEVESATAALTQAKADYEALLAGVPPAELAQAQARLERARANLQEVSGQVTADDLEAARKALAAREAALAALLEGQKPEAVAVTRSQLEANQAALQQTRDRASAEKTVAEARLTEAANDVRTAQDRYSRIQWENKSRFGDSVPLLDKEREDNALREVENAESRLAQALVEAETARQQEQNLIEAAEARVREAESRLALQLRGPDPDAVAGAQAAVADARARVASLSGDQRAGTLGEAEAQVAEAQAAIERLTADPATTDLAIAEAKVVRAEVGLKQTELNLEQATLRAPVAGTVAALDLAVGKVVEARAPVLTLASLGTWQVLIEDLNELNVVHIREGDTAIIQFFALPGLELRGRVQSIEARGRSDKNVGTVYSVVVIPETWDERLRWNMTASVSIVSDGS